MLLIIIFSKKISKNKIDELMKKYKIKSNTFVFLYSGKLIKKKMFKF